MLAWRERTGGALAQLSAALGGLDAGSLAALAPEVEEQGLEPGSVLFHEGDPSDAFYVVVRGDLRVTVAGPRGDVVVGHIGPGKPVGELASVLPSLLGVLDETMTVTARG